jgi:hypothetical protein
VTNKAKGIVVNSKKVTTPKQLGSFFFRSPSFKPKKQEETPNPEPKLRAPRQPKVKTKTTQSIMQTLNASINQHKQYQREALVAYSSNVNFKER